MTAILILHGPNLNLLGSREPDVYGTMTLEEINMKLVELGKSLGTDVKCLQSNHEGVLIDALHEACRLGKRRGVQPWGIYPYFHRPAGCDRSDRNPGG